MNEWMNECFVTLNHWLVDVIVVFLSEDQQTEREEVVGRECNSLWNGGGRRGGSRGGGGGWMSKEAVKLFPHRGSSVVYPFANHVVSF